MVCVDAEVSNWTLTCPRQALLSHCTNPVRQGSCSDSRVLGSNSSDRVRAVIQECLAGAWRGQVKVQLLTSASTQTIIYASGNITGPTEPSPTVLVTDTTDRDPERLRRKH